MITQKDLTIYLKYHGDQNALLRMAHLTNETVSDWSLIESLVQDWILIQNGHASPDSIDRSNEKLHASCEDEATIGELKRVALKIANQQLEFNHLYWHDSIITNITIDRSDPGYIDTIKLDMNWMDEGKGHLIFEGVYKLQLNMNFGIIANESILTASCSSDRTNPDLVNLYRVWGGRLDAIELNAFTIELNSAGSLIKIIAKLIKVFFERGNRTFIIK
jgi:hypothetical protein